MKMRVMVAGFCTPTGLLLMCACPAVLAQPHPIWGKVLFIILLGGGGALTFLAGILYMAGWGRTSFDKGTGEYRQQMYLGPFRYQNVIFPLEEVTMVALKRHGHNLDTVMVELRGESGAPVRVCGWSDWGSAYLRATEIASFLGVKTQVVKLTMGEAAKTYRTFANVLLLAIICLLAFFAWFTVTRGTPLARWISATYQFKGDNVVEAPCRIVSFETAEHQPLPEGKYRTEDKGGGSRYVAECTVVNVRFEYAYAKEQYESTQYGYLHNYVLSTPPYNEDMKAVCYLNPDSPDQAVLSLDDEIYPNIDVLGLLGIGIMTPLTLCVMFLVRRIMRKRFLEKGWIEEFQGTA